MYKTISFLVLLLFSLPLLAQHAPPQVPESVFPIVAFDISTLHGVNLDQPNSGNDRVLEQLLPAGFNSIYHVNSAEQSWARRLAARLPKGMRSYIGAAQLGGFENTYIGNRFGNDAGIPNTFGSEIRYFLATNETHADFDFEKFEYTNGVGTGKVWNVVEGAKDGKEWRIPATAGSLLKLSVPSVTFKAGKQTGNVAYVDFIYRIDPSVVQSSSATLFKINTSLGSHNITRAHYDNRVSNYIQQEHEAIKRFPITLPPGTTNYATFRFEVDLANTDMSIELEGMGITPIWVRGFRVRSSMAEDVLRGFKNTEIIAALNAAKNQLKDPCQFGDCSVNPPTAEMIAKGQTAWRNMKSLAACGEATFEVYRVLAYIDKASRSVLGKPLYSFLSTNVNKKAYSLYRAVYEDETGSPPPVVMQETFDMYQKDWGTPVYMPSDGIPAQQFFPSTGETFHDLGYTVAHGKVPSGSNFDYSGYATYTAKMQTMYEKAADDYELAALAAFGERNSTRKHTKWYAMISTLLNFRNKETQLVKTSDAVWNTTFKTNVRQKYLDALQLGEGGDFIREGRVNYNEMYVPENGITDDLDNTTGTNIEEAAVSTPEKPVFRMYVSSRGPFATELRADVWDALSYGAKGIVYNSIPFLADPSGRLILPV